MTTELEKLRKQMKKSIEAKQKGVLEAKAPVKSTLTNTDKDIRNALQRIYTIISSSLNRGITPNKDELKERLNYIIKLDRKLKDLQKFSYTNLYKFINDYFAQGTDKPKMQKVFISKKQSKQPVVILNVAKFLEVYNENERDFNKQYERLFDNIMTILSGKIPTEQDEEDVKNLLEKFESYGDEEEEFANLLYKPPMDVKKITRFIIEYRNQISDLLSPLEFLQKFTEKIKIEEEKQQQKDIEKFDDLYELFNEKYTSQEMYDMAKKINPFKYYQVDTRHKSKIFKLDKATDEIIEDDSLGYNINNLKSTNPPMELRKILVENVKCNDLERTKPWVNDYLYTLVKPIESEDIDTLDFLSTPSELDNEYSAENNWYRVNKKYSKYICRLDNPPTQTGRTQIIYDEDNKKHKLEVVYVTKKNNYIPLDEKLANKRLEYLNKLTRSKMDNINIILDKNIMNLDDYEKNNIQETVINTLKSTFERHGIPFDNSDIRVLENEVYKLYLNSTVKQYLEQISTIIVIMDLPFYGTELNKKLSQQLITPDVLADMDIKSLLPSFFMNPSVNETLKYEMEQYINNFKNDKVLELSDKIYNLMDPSTTYVEFFYNTVIPSIPSKYTDVESIEKSCSNDLDEDDSIVAYYQDPEDNKMYCITKNILLDILKSNKFINPYTNKEFTKEFKKYLKKFSIPDENNIKKATETVKKVISDEDKEYVPYEQYKELAPGFLKLLDDSIGESRESVKIAKLKYKYSTTKRKHKKQKRHSFDDTQVDSDKESEKSNLPNLEYESSSEKSNSSNLEYESSSEKSKSPNLEESDKEYNFSDNEVIFKTIKIDKGKPNIVKYSYTKLENEDDNNWSQKLKNKK